jgi:hypothetical protein
LRLVPQHRHGQCAVQSLMLARQARQGQIQSAVSVAVTQLALAHHRSPMQAPGLPNRSGIMCNFANPFGDWRRVELGDKRHPALGDAGLFGGHGVHCGA